MRNQDVLLDRAVFQVSEEKFDAFLELLASSAGIPTPYRLQMGVG